MRRRRNILLHLESGRTSTRNRCRPPLPSVPARCPPSPERKSAMTIKQTLIATALLSAIAFAGNAAAQDATDSSALSNEQLIQLRSEVRNMSAEDKARFRPERQSRARKMPPEDSQQTRETRSEP